MTTDTFLNFPCITWRVKNAYSVSRLEYENIALGRYSFTLCLEQTTCKNSLDDYFSICMKLPENYGYNLPYLLLQTSVYVKDKKGRNCFTQYAKTLPYSSMLVRIWCVKRQNLFEESSNVLINDVLTIVCMFGPEGTQSVPKIVTSEKCIQTSPYITDSCLNSLSFDFQNMLEGKVQSDIVIKSGSYSFSAHKTILSARSEVFAAMFHSDMLESQNGILEVEDINDDIMDQFLHYIYSGKLSNLSDVSVRYLYEAADKYAVEGLKKRCSSFMMKNVTKETAFEFIALADAHSDQDFKDCIISIILKDEKMLKSQEFLAFLKNQPLLATEVYSHYVNGE